MRPSVPLIVLERGLGPVVSIVVPEPVWHKVKIMAATRKLTLQEAVAQAFVEWAGRKS